MYSANQDVFVVQPGLVVSTTIIFFFFLGGGAVDLAVKLWDILHEDNITLTLLIGAAVFPPPS
jgi:hypothetical protein